jgi:prepilin-type N-terminal cleavage/methylation domain-containing protein
VTPRAARAHRCSERGHTLLELTVASTIVSIFAVVLASASTAFFGLLDDLHARAQNLRSANMIRARLLGDARATTTATCAGGAALQFQAGEGAGVSQIEYTTSEGTLLRWVSTTDRQTALAEHVSSLACDDLGERGLEVDVVLGAAERPLYLYFHVARPPAEEEEEEEEEEGGA